MKFCVFSSDPLYKYAVKGELRQRYWNPQGMFDEVLVVTFADEEVAPDRVQRLVGEARLQIEPIGRFRPHHLRTHLRRARERVAAFSPDLIRAHGPWHAGLAGVCTAGACGVPSILSVHTSHPERRRHERGLRLRLLQLLERYTIPRADCVLCVSHHLTDYARTCRARRVEVIYNRVYVEQFDVSRASEAPRRPRILSVGRLDPPKDQACLIEAARDLDVELTLVGEGVNRLRLAEMVRRHGMEDRVTFISAVPHDRLQQVYAEADIFAMASAYEGFGIPVLEAMASGLPVVVNDIGPLVELVGDTGIVIEGLDAEGFRGALRRLMEDPGRARAMGELGRRRARGFDGRLMERREAQLYRELIASSPSPETADRDGCPEGVESA
jgi:glycosyltransferase involved in cell wall biosynthesis